MGERVRFSIVVVCLNAGRLLGETVESVLKQTYRGFEIVVKDGGSSDGSVEGLPVDERIRVFRERDAGIYDAMNQAVLRVAGEAVYFLNCGDVFWDKNVLARVNERMEEYERETGGPVEKAIFYGDIHERLTGERVSSNPHMDAFGCYRNVPCHQACFYGAELMRQKGFDTDFAVRADYEHFLWCFFAAGAKTVYLPLLIADYEGGGFSEREENRRRSREEHKRITEKYMTRGQLLKYRLIMLVTLSSFRTWLSRGRATAHLYNRLKALVYRR